MTRRFTFDNRFLGPILITAILIGAHLSFGILEGYVGERVSRSRWRSWRNSCWAG